MPINHVGAAMRWHCNPSCLNTLRPEQGLIKIVAPWAYHFQSCTQEEVVERTLRERYFVGVLAPRRRKEEPRVE